MRKLRCYLVVFVVFCLVLTTMPLNTINAFAMERQIDSAFSKMQIETETGELVEDLLDGSLGDTKAIPGHTYYFRVTVKKPAGYDYVEIRLGNEAQDGTLSPNGLKFLSPPGGVYTPGPIVHDSFDSIVKRIEIADPIYGSKSKKYVLNDGEIMYHVKDTIKDDSYFDFEFSFTVDEIAYNNLPTLVNGLAVTLYQNEDKTGENKDVEIDVPVQQKPQLTSGHSPSTMNVVPGYGALTANVLGGASLAFLYDRMEYDLEYPQGAYLEGVGFNSNFITTHDQYGVLSLGEPTASENAGYEKVHVTIGPGYKKAESDIWLYFKVIFPEEYFSPGQTQYSYMRNLKIYLDGNEENPLVVSTDKKATYNLVDPNNDATTMITMDRTVYNLTNDSAKEYYVPLGCVRMENTSTLPTPREKIIEASYNTTNTAARVMAVTIPQGSIEKPVVELTGIDASGDQKTVTITDGLTLKKANLYGIPNNYFFIEGNKYGLYTITGLKADIGKVTGGYKTSSWSSVWNVDNNKLAAFGMFTTKEAGLEVISQYHLYNKEPEYRHNKNGDLYCTTKTTSTHLNYVGMQNVSFYMKDENGNNIINAPSIEAGRSVSIQATMIPYYAPETTVNTNGTDNGKGVMNPDTSSTKQRGTSLAVADPVVYMYLPKGMNYKDLQFTLNKAVGVPGSRAATGVPLDYTISGVSYLNTKEDGVSIYKITFPEDTLIGGYDENGNQNELRINVTFTTSRSMATGSYAFNDLIQLTNKTGLEGTVIANGGLINVKRDEYNLNDGKYLIGVSSGNIETAVHLQEIAEIQVDNAITVTKINNQDIENPEWFTYQTVNGEPDGNTIALLGMKSEGQIRLNVTNRGSDPSKKIEIVMPIPKKGENMGTMFMDEPFEYTMNVTWDEADIPEGYSARYVMLEKHDGLGAFEYREIEENEKGNAVLLSADSMAGRSNFTAYFNYYIDDGQPQEINVFRTAHTYRTSNNQVYNRVGSYVAAQVATGTVQGTVFYDANRNGIQDQGEDNMPDVTVVVTDSKGRVQTVKTDENGEYRFDAVREENVTLEFKIDKNNETVGEYRLNVPIEGLETSEDGLSATKEYESMDTLTIQNVPVSTYYTIEYQPNGGTGYIPESETCPENEYVTVKKNPDNLKKLGYKFKEWNTEADGSGQGYLPGAAIQATAEACGLDDQGNCDRTIELYAIWEEATYTIYLNYRGGTPAIQCGSILIKGLNSKVADTFKTQTGEIMPLVWYSGSAKRSAGDANAPTKNGYIFDGWSTSAANDSYKVTTSTSVSSMKLSADATLYATWIPKTGYTVTYDTAGGSTVESQTDLKWNSYVTPTGNPTKTGYTFAGWKYGDVDVERHTTYESLAVEDSVTSIELTAKWTEKTDFTVKYEDDIFPEKTVGWLSTDLYPQEEPSKEGYAFEGWSLTKGGDAIASGTDYATLADDDDTVTEITLYPIWTEVTEDQVVVKYDTAGGNIVPDKITTPDAANLLPAENPERTGYTFVSWTYNNEDVDNATTYESLATEDQKTITLVATWETKKYTVTYDVKVTGQAGDYSDKLKEWTETGLIPEDVPSYPGSTFQGWYYGDVKVTEADSVSTLAPNNHLSDSTLPLAAKWAKNLYSVEYDTAGGTYVEPKTGLFYESTNLIPTTNPVLEGYNCVGWSHGVTTVSDSMKVGDLLDSDDAVSVTLKAVYEEKTGYTVKYDTTGGSAIADLTNVSWNQENLIPDTNPTKKGFAFAGWVCGRVSVSTTTKYGAVATSDQAGSFVTMVAEWTPIKSTIVYKDGESDFNWGEVNHPTTYTYGMPQNLVDGTKENTAFYGWFRDASFTGTRVETLTATEEANSSNQIVLYGKWIPIYAVSVSANPTTGGTVTGGGNYENGATVYVTATAATGYIFKGWKEGNNTVSSTSTYTFTATGARTLVANFVPEYTITVSANPTTGGTVTGGGNYESGASVSVTATAATGYVFKGWKEGNNTVSTSGTYTFTATGARTLVANFVPEYTITVSANPTEGGTVTGGGNYESGASISVTATAATGYAFKGWKEGNNTVSTSGTYTFTATGARTLVANFVPEYPVTVASSPAEGGLVTGSGTYEEGTEVTVTATSAEGFIFKNWQEGNKTVSTGQTYTFNIENARNLVANFIPEYIVVVTANPAEGGTVTGGGNYEEGTEVTVTATPEEGYIFKGWSEGGHTISSNQTYTFDATGTKSLVANFVPEYTITVTANPTEGGIVTGGGKYEEATEVTVTAVTTEGYIFKGWKEEDDIVSTNAAYKFDAETSRTLVATFVHEYTVTATANPAAGGIVTGSGNYEEGTTVTVTATAEEGYVFKGWKEGDNVVSTEKVYTFDATTSRTLVASFAAVYPITTVADPLEGGEAAGGGDYEEGTEVTVTASPAEGYIFKGWIEDDNKISESETYIFDAESPRDLVASFVKEYTITATANPAVGGTATGSGTYEEGAEVTVTATAAEGYIFKGWKEGEETISTSMTYGFAVDSSRTLIADFVAQHTISVEANPEGAGEVTGAGKYEDGAEVTVTATAAEGYTFKGWKEGEETVSTDGTYKFNAEEDRNLTAVFEEVIPSPNEYSIAVTATPIEGGTVTGGGNYEEGAEVTVTATAAEGYTFKGWKEGEETVSTDGTYKFNAEEDRNLTAVFEEVIPSPNEYSIAVTATPIEGGTVTGGGNYEEGAEVTVTATAAEGYTFKGWKEGDETVSTDGTYKFNAEEDRTLTAVFEEVIPEPSVYEIKVSANPTEGGTVTGSGNYEEGTEVTVTATAAEGYIFIGWKEDTKDAASMGVSAKKMQASLLDNLGDFVSSESTYKFKAEKSMNLVAVFSQDTIVAKIHVLTVTAEPEEGGTVTGSGNYEEGTRVSVTASAKDGYSFKGWQEGDTIVNTEESYSFDLQSDRHLIAIFEKEETQGNPGDSEENPSNPGDSEENPSNPGDSGENPSNPGDSEENPSNPGDSEENPSNPGDSGENPANPDSHNQGPADGSTKPAAPAVVDEEEQYWVVIPYTGDSTSAVETLAMLITSSLLCIFAIVNQKKKTIK